MRLIDAPVGLFMFEETLCLKTEYANPQGGVEAYIVSSGEVFWGRAKTQEERNNLDVTPVNADNLRPHGRWIAQDETLTKFMCSACEAKNYDGHEKFCPNCGAKMDLEDDRGIHT